MVGQIDSSSHQESSSEKLSSFDSMEAKLQKLDELSHKDYPPDFGDKLKNSNSTLYAKIQSLDGKSNENDLKIAVVELDKELDKIIAETESFNKLTDRLNFLIGDKGGLKFSIEDSKNISISSTDSDVDLKMNLYLDKISTVIYQWKVEGLSGFKGSGDDLEAAMKTSRDIFTSLKEAKRNNAGEAPFKLEDSKIKMTYQHDKVSGSYYPSFIKQDEEMVAYLNEKYSGPFIQSAVEVAPVLIQEEVVTTPSAVEKAPRVSRESFLKKNPDLTKFYELKGNVITIKFDGNKDAERVLKIQDLLKNEGENAEMKLTKKGVDYTWNAEKKGFYSGEYRMQIVDKDEITIGDAIKEKPAETKEEATMRETLAAKFGLDADKLTDMKMDIASSTATYIYERNGQDYKVKFDLKSNSATVFDNTGRLLGDASSAKHETGNLEINWLIDGIHDEAKEHSDLQADIKKMNESEKKTLSDVAERERQSLELAYKDEIKGKLKLSGDIQDFSTAYNPKTKEFTSVAFNYRGNLIQVYGDKVVIIDSDKSEKALASNETVDGVINGRITSPKLATTETVKETVESDLEVVEKYETININPRVEATTECKDLLDKTPYNIQFKAGGIMSINGKDFNFSGLESLKVKMDSGNLVITEKDTDGKEFVYKGKSGKEIAESINGQEENALQDIKEKFKTDGKKLDEGEAKNLLVRRDGLQASVPGINMDAFDKCVGTDYFEQINVIDNFVIDINALKRDFGKELSAKGVENLNAYLTQGKLAEVKQIGGGLQMHGHYTDKNKMPQGTIDRVTRLILDFNTVKFEHTNDDLGMRVTVKNLDGQMILDENYAIIEHEINQDPKIESTSDGIDLMKKFVDSEGKPITFIRGMMHIDNKDFKFGVDTGSMKIKTGGMGKMLIMTETQPDGQVNVYKGYNAHDIAESMMDVYYKLHPDVQDPRKTS